MRKFILSLLFISLAPFINAQTITVIDDFETGVGRFTLEPTFSGSTTGLSTSPAIKPVVETTTAQSGSQSLKVELVDNAALDAGWQVRLLSGGGSPANNATLSSTGFAGYWLKTDAAYLSAGFIMDAGGSEKSNMVPVNGDGQWHLYEWNLSDTSQWNAWAGTGTNGIIEDPVSIDAIWFSAPVEAVNGQTAVVYIDYVYYSTESAVPVELVSFASSVSGNEVNLRWATASELNNKGFEVERKEANGTFTKIGFVDGKGTTTDLNSYTYSDKVSGTGTYLYRLKQVDFDGSFEYSNIVEAVINAVPDKYTLAQNFPNPFNPVTSITFNIPEAGIVNLAVYNLLGEKVAELVNEQKEMGTYTVNFDASKLASGTYIYSLNVNGTSLTKKMALMK